MYDLALSSDGDLIFAGNRDLQGISGYALINQRIRLRCKIPRGSWIYDEEKTLGSEIYTVLRSTTDDAQIKIPVYVRQALATMDEINIEDITVEFDGTSALVTIFYTDASNTQLNPDLEQDVFATQVIL